MGLIRRWGVSPEATALALLWARLLTVALVVAAGAGAAQVGVAYGFGLVRFADPAGAGGHWSTQLTWVVWFAALAALAGAVGGAWQARRQDQVLELGGRIAVAVVAGIGAAVVAPLSALPARVVELTTRNPALEAGLAAGLGVVIGILAAVAVLNLREVATNVAAVVGGVWLLALVSLLPSFGPTADRPAIRLGVLDLPTFDDGARSTLGVLTPPIIALLVGGVTAGLARLLEKPPRPTIVAAPAGAVVLAFSYLVAGPGPSGDRTAQLAPYAGSLIAIAAGLLAAVLVTIVRLPAPRDPAAAAAGTDTADQAPWAEQESPADQTRAEQPPWATPAAATDLASGGSTSGGMASGSGPATGDGFGDGPASSDRFGDGPGFRAFAPANPAPPAKPDWPAPSSPAPYPPMADQPSSPAAPYPPVADQPSSPAPYPPMADQPTASPAAPWSAEPTRSASLFDPPTPTFEQPTPVAGSPAASAPYPPDGPAPTAPPPVAPPPVAPAPVAPPPQAPPPVADAPTSPAPPQIPQQRDPAEEPSKKRGWRGGRSKATKPAKEPKAPKAPKPPKAAKAPPPAPAEEDYLGWVRDLGAEEAPEEKEPVRRRLRPGSGDELRDADIEPPRAPGSHR